MNHRLLAVPLLLAAACATPTAPAPTPQTREQEVELQTFQKCQRAFQEATQVPQIWEFPGHGRVTVRDVSLDGFPGNTYVRCRFHYQNRTEKPIVQTWVMLDVLDKDGHMVASQATVCIVPVPIPIARGSFFADELRTQTFDAHLQPGWSWRIRCIAQPEEDEEPLNPPVPGRKATDTQLAPVPIKDRTPRRN